MRCSQHDGLVLQDQKGDGYSYMPLIFHQCENIDLDLCWVRIDLCWVHMSVGI